jgi:ankyrin repeat protein
MPDNDDFVSGISRAVMADDAGTLDTLITTPSLTDPEELGGWLSLASAEGKLEALRVLLRRGANVNFRTKDGESPFSYACASNQLDAAKLLFEAGADVNAPLATGESPLDWAVCWSSPEFRAWLRRAGGKRTRTFEEWP